MNIIVSIVTYNNSGIITETIESLLQNTKDISFRVVVFDNASTDSTADVVEGLKDNRVEVIRSIENIGFGRGHNEVAKRYNADYLLIYNPDVRVKNNILHELCCFMESHEDVGMVTPKIIYDNGELQYLCKNEPTFFDLFIRRFAPGCLKKITQKRCDWYEMRYTGYDTIFSVPYATGCFMLFRYSVWTELQGFDPNIFMYLEDADITKRTNQLSQCVFYPYNFVEHLWERGSHKSLYLTWINIKSAIYYFNKWGWKLW